MTEFIREYRDNKWLGVKHEHDAARFTSIHPLAELIDKHFARLEGLNSVLGAEIQIIKRQLAAAPGVPDAPVAVAPSVVDPALEMLKKALETEEGRALVESVMKQPPVMITPGPSKGGQNEPNESSARPPEPQGSGGMQDKESDSTDGVQSQTATDGVQEETPSEQDGVQDAADDEPVKVEGEAPTTGGEMTYAEVPGDGVQNKADRSTREQPEGSIPGPDGEFVKTG